jgi:hypothetical protein
LRFAEKLPQTTIIVVGHQRLRVYAVDQVGRYDAVVALSMK